MSNKQ